MGERKQSLGLNHLTYEEMAELAKLFGKENKTELAAHIVQEMVKKWPERVLNPRKNPEKQQRSNTAS